MLFDGGRVAYGESFEESCGFLVGDSPEGERKEIMAWGSDSSYLDESDDPRAAMRIRYAVGRAVVVQAHINAGRWDEIQAMDEESRRVVDGRRDEQPAVGEWPHNVPLVLCSHEAHEEPGDVDRPLCPVRARRRGPRRRAEPTARTRSGIPVARTGAAPTVIVEVVPDPGPLTVQTNTETSPPPPS